MLSILEITADDWLLMEGEMTEEPDTNTLLLLSWLFWLVGADVFCWPCQLFKHLGPFWFDISRCVLSLGPWVHYSVGRVLNWDGVSIWERESYSFWAMGSVGIAHFWEWLLLDFVLAVSVCVCASLPAQLFLSETPLYVFVRFLYHDAMTKRFCSAISFSSFFFYSDSFDQQKSLGRFLCATCCPSRRLCPLLCLCV